MLLNFHQVQHVRCMYMFDALWEHVVHTLRLLEGMRQSPFSLLRDHTERRMKSVQKNFPHVVLYLNEIRLYYCSKKEWTWVREEGGKGDNNIMVWDQAKRQ